MKHKQSAEHDNHIQRASAGKARSKNRLINQRSESPTKGNTLAGRRGWGQQGDPYLAHDADGRLAGGAGHAMLHQVEHVLVVQQADEVEGAEAGRAAQGQVPDHHGAGGGEVRHEAGGHSAWECAALNVLTDVR